MLANAFAFASSASRRRTTAGSSVRSSSIAEATCIAVGKVSLLDWLMLTWSLGCTGFFEPRTPPASSIARFETTSFTFMLLWVPEPVCQTLSGNSASSRPSATSRAALTIRSRSSGARPPNSAFASAQAALSRPNAWITGSGMRSPKGK